MDAQRDEFELKGGFWTTAAVNARLASSFDAADVPAAALALATLVGEDPGGDPEVSDLISCRLMLAALKLAEGDLARLGLWIAAGVRDPRDLIAAAEYRRELVESTPEARDADLAEYLAWCAGAESPTKG